MTLTLFVDSGAHSLFNLHVHKKKQSVRRDKRFAFYDTKEFWSYVDSYAEWVKKNIWNLDYYVTVDAIHNPEKTWEVQKYLEEEHDLDPIPVVHSGTPIKWLRKYLENGYKFIGLGGVSLEGTGEDYVEWANNVYSEICPKPSYIPEVRTHGFAMSRYEFLIKWPWWSVDSASWAKSAAFGSILVPHKRNGEFTFEEKPYNVAVTQESSAKKTKGRHFDNMSAHQQRIVMEWVEQTGVPFGNDKELGLSNNYRLRARANVLFFQKLGEWLPIWPWKFQPDRIKKGFFV